MNCIGYLSPDGTHYACESWEHRALARKITGIPERTLLDVCDDGTMPPDAEQVLDERGYLRIEKNDPEDPEAISFGARWHDNNATLTDAQRAWLRVNGYAVALRRFASQSREGR